MLRFWLRGNRVVKVRWTGLTEFLREFGSIPQALHSEGMDIIRDETEGAAVEISQQYARKTGTLAKRVKTSYPSSSILVGIAQSTAPHAHLYEFTHKNRQRRDGSRTTFKGRNVTVPIARRRRARMARRMVELLRRKGFNVGNGQ